MTPPPATDPPAPLEGVPDLTLADCCQRWGVNSRNSVKARAAALGVELRRESSTRTVWPAEWLPLGDELQEHLSGGGKLADFPGSVTAPAGGSDALAELAAAITPPPPPPDPLSVARGLAVRGGAGPLAGGGPREGLRPGPSLPAPSGVAESFLQSRLKQWGAIFWYRLHSP